MQWIKGFNQIGQQMTTDYGPPIEALLYSFHSKNTGEEEYLFLLYNEAYPPL